MEDSKTASLGTEMPDQYARNPSITSQTLSLDDNDDNSMNELAERLLTDGTKVSWNFIDNCSNIQ